jgi:hypothetical protein
MSYIILTLEEKYDDTYTILCIYLHRGKKSTKITNTLKFVISKHQTDLDVI